MKQNRTGFTLVELLAVIVIMAIIALIAVPTIVNILTKARKGAFEASVYGVVEALNLEYSTTELMEGKYEDTLFKFPNTTLQIKGDVPEGAASIDSEGNMTLALYDKNKTWCAKKGLNEEEITFGEYDSNCINLSLKEVIENDTKHIAKNVKVNGETVNKVIGTKAEKLTMKNYVWYMGQLWQVLETNDTDETIKLITAQSLTAIAYGETSQWSTSWVRKWLNNVFLNSLEGTELMANTNFCLDKVDTTSTEITRGDYKILSVSAHTSINNCQNQITEKVGLMTFEDYVYASDGVNADYDGGSFLDEDEGAFTMTAYDNEFLWIQWYEQSFGGYITVNTVAKYTPFGLVKGNGLGLRPVISIKDTAIISSGTGTKSNPYILVNEQIAEENTEIDNAKVGDYIYLDESNNSNNFTSEYVARDLSYSTTKDKVRYRIVSKNTDGSIKVQRADVLRNLPNTVAIKNGMYVPYYYKEGEGGCVYGNDTTGCTNNNIFKIEGNTSEYKYTDSINIGDFLNSSSNSFYSWYSDETKNMIEKSTYHRYTDGYKKDYSNLNDGTATTYPGTTNDGDIQANVVLPSYGEMYTGNDINVPYWHINRKYGHNNHVSAIFGSGTAQTTQVFDPSFAVRPVVTLKSTVKISSGEGTMTNPYVLTLN